MVASLLGFGNPSPRLTIIIEHLPAELKLPTCVRGWTGKDDSKAEDHARVDVSAYRTKEG